MPEVVSENITHIDWDANILTITFKDGSTRNYSGFPEVLFGLFVGAPSVDDFFKDNIDGMYDYE